MELYLPSQTSPKEKRKLIMTLDTCTLSHDHITLAIVCKNTRKFPCRLYDSLIFGFTRFSPLFSNTIYHLLSSSSLYRQNPLLIV